METHDVYVKKIIQKPYKHIDLENCCWEVVVEVYYDGRFDERTIKACTKTEIQKYKPGYSWVE